MNQSNPYIKNLNRIEFVVTMACTGHCKHCSEGDRRFHTGHIDADVAADAIREICAQYRIASLMTFGGEPLIYPEVICQIHRTATEMGIPRREVITNGFFSKDKKRIRAVTESLASSGVREILLSVDAFHQETIPLDPVKYFAASVKDCGISVKLSPAWLRCEADNNPYNTQTKEILNAFADLKIPVGEGNIIFPSGNARKYLHEYFDTHTEYIHPYAEDPRDVRTVCFSPGGKVLNGNIYQNNISEIISAYNP